MSEPEPAEEPRSSKARRVFIESVLNVVGIERTPQMERACDLMLMAMIEQGVFVMAMPESVARTLAVNDKSDIRSTDDTSIVETRDAATDLQGDLVPHDGRDGTASRGGHHREDEEGGR